MSAKKVTIVLICCLLVVLGAAVCALLELYPKDVLTAEAASEQKPRFVIATENGVDWTLSLNGENVDGAECSGRFTDTSNSVAKRMYESIKQSLRDMGLDVPAKGDFVVAEHCDIAFELPSISSQVDANEAAYGSDGVFFKQDINDVISTPRVYFEYRKKGDEQWQEAQAYFTIGGYRFGRGIDVGEYEVRIVATETFLFEATEDGEQIQYSAKRCGQIVDCRITKADLILSKSADKEITYGTSIADVANVLRLSDFCDMQLDGRFVLSDTQTDEELLSATDKNSAYLGVKDGGHVVYFDFIPSSDNYNILKNAKVQIAVKPRSLYVRIRDAYSLVGEELYTPEYQIVSPLVAGDGVESLGVRIENDADKDVASMTYKTLVRFSNPNYVADCHSHESQFANYGRYFVYAKQIEVVADDGQKFYVFYGGGLVDVSIKVVRVEIENVYGKPLVCAYRFDFIDENGEVATPDGFSVSWQSVQDGVEYFAVYGGELSNISVGNVTLSKENNVLCFFEGEKTGGALTPANVALIAVCCVLACVLVALCVVAGMIVQRHNADMRMLKKHVYTRETWAKTADCANNAKTENRKAKENGEPKKLRHGKKNKLNKTQNEANK